MCLDNISTSLAKVLRRREKESTNYTNSDEFPRNFIKELFNNSCNSRKFVQFVVYLLMMTLPLLMSFFVSCSEVKDENILASIGDVEITVEEFLNRSEFTPRPHYCRSDSEQDKIIILNTLVLEKIFALEGRKQSDLLEKTMFNAYIRGRKEQYMREELFSQMAINEDQLDSAEISNALNLAGLIYDVEFYRLDTDRAEALRKEMQSNPQRKDSLFKSVNYQEEIPRHTVRFEDPEFSSLHHTLFGKKWKKGDIVGPVRLRETKYMILKINNVSYNPAITQTEFLNRRILVKEKLIEKRSNQRWNQFTAHLMNGKTIEFVPHITKKVAKLWSDKFNSKDPDIQVRGGLDKRSGRFVQEIELLEKEPMFKVNNDIWTVSDFKNAILSHPLVFRKADLAPSELLAQFRLAVVDLVQDCFVTDKAYARNIDDLKSIRRNVAMWEDAYLAVEHRQKVLSKKRNGDGQFLKIKDFHKLIDPYINELKNKYQSQIYFNAKLLMDQRLTQTDYVTTQQFVPYQQIVPAFPFLTRSDPLGLSSLLN